MIIDAKDETLGRLASRIAGTLQDKQKTSFRPEMVGSEIVEVKNIDRMKINKRKLQKKVYYRYSGYPGGLKKMTLGELLEKDPGGALKKAVFGMLPKNKLRKQRMKRLKIR